MKFISEWIENIVGNGEKKKDLENTVGKGDNAGNQHYLHSVSPRSRTLS